MQKHTQNNLTLSGKLSGTTLDVLKHNYFSESKPKILNTADFQPKAASFANIQLCHSNTNCETNPLLICMAGCGVLAENKSISLSVPGHKFAFSSGYGKLRMGKVEAIIHRNKTSDYVNGTNITDTKSHRTQKFVPHNICWIRRKETI